MELRGSDRILLLSCYEQGHQPIALASALGTLRQAGFAPAARDLSVSPFDADGVSAARLVAISVPMHTALRLGAVAARRVREENPDAHICLFGLYASLNAEYLLGGVADSVIGGDAAQPLLDLALALEADDGRRVGGVRRRGELAEAPRSPGSRQWPPPDRRGLPPLEKYARLARGEQRVLAGAVEATRGCLHHCRHCPITPVFDGRLVVIPEAVVLADIEQLVGAGARHITFADPDFLNGPGCHSRRIVQALAARFRGVTFDFTAKVDQLIRHASLLPELVEAGAVFCVTAVESLSDVVLDALDKGHTREDVHQLLDIARDVGLPVRPSLLPFTPWSTLSDYLDLLRLVDTRQLHHQIDPVQLAVRLLLPPGSALLDRARAAGAVRALDEDAFAWTWSHPDPRMDDLHAAVAGLVSDAATTGRPAVETFAAIWDLAHERAGLAAGAAPSAPHPSAAETPRLTEPWF